MVNMSNNTENRFKIVYTAICFLFILLFARIVYMTAIKGEDYYLIAENKVYRNIETQAPRGEIRDRNGVLLAGSKPSFTVSISQNELNQEGVNETASLLMNILKENQETYIDEFPIVFTENGYAFTYEQKVRDWKVQNNIDLSKNAEESFRTVARNLNDQGIIKINPEDSDLEIQRKINQAGFYPPISISKMEFTEFIKKQEWLLRYRIRQEDITAEEAFKRLKTFHNIDENISDDKARDIMVIKDLLRSKGYFQYEPAVVAMDISKTTVSKIEELSLELPGVSVDVEPIRYYPNGAFASHILGQIGRISSQDEIEKYVTGLGYNRSDMIGKTGIEKHFEDVLRGENGYRRVQVDAFGRLIENIETTQPSAGDTVYLTIDSKLQKVAEESLKKTLETIQVGGIYESQWGNMRLRNNRRVYNKATSGAVVAMDVRTGEILAMASYPDYDPNLFATGISIEDMANLMPANMNDPLAPKPLYNIATMTAVQPGSTFKMITGLAAIENGLDPNYKIKDEGFIELGGRSFGCWLWNVHRQKHGEEDLIGALRDSCNYYFYSVSVGYDYSKDKPLPVKVSSQDILEMSKLFGLDNLTGVQIEEISGRVPNPDQKLIETRRSLYFDIYNRMANHFTDINQNSQAYEDRINEIVGWTQENPSRSELMRRMASLNVKKELVEEITDHVKYSYYTQGNWNQGDTFNLAIGQGAHAYTPIQMANYISVIANDGYLNKVTVVDKIESYDKKQINEIPRESERIPLNNYGNLEYLRRGMIDVSDEGTAKQLFEKFPIKVASKTGTAQKTGTIPEADEEAYLLRHLRDFNLNQARVLERAEELEKESNENLPKHRYIRRAIKDLNPSLTDTQINRFKDTYDNFAWFVSYAPHDNPEIAVVSLIFQGGSGGYAGPVARDIMAQYFGLYDEEELIEEDPDSTSDF